MRNHIISLFIAGVLIFSSSGIAGSEEERIIAGEYLARLWDATVIKFVKIEHPELKSQILDHSLAAILIPKSQKEREYVIRRCFEKRTVFDSPDLKVSKKDYEELIIYASNKVFALVDNLANSANEPYSLKYKNSVNKLNEYITNTAGEKRASARRFAGALIADVEISRRELSMYIDGFRKYIEQKAIKKMEEPEFAVTLNNGDPYFWGSKQFNSSDLGRINPAHVKHLKLGQKNYRTVWVGSTFIITPQLDWPIYWKDPTGLAISEKWFGSHTAKMVANLPKFKGEGT